MYYAHSAERREGWEPLKVHLEEVAGRAAGFAEVFGAGDEARLAGLLHDLGKYSERFTARLEGKARHLDHWSAGAWAAVKNYRLLAAALAIQGHHVGLQKLGANYDHLKDLEPGRLSRQHPLGLTLTEANVELLLARLAADGLVLPAVERPLLDHQAKTLPLAAMLDVRMLFSALVDADFLETEAHFRGATSGRREYREAGPPLDADQAVAVLDAHLARLAAEHRAALSVVQLRQDLLAACRAAAALEPGLFTLTAPTGTGKTLAMLAFALEHARRHGLRRVVAVIPYLSIIEQTAQVYGDLLRPVFGDHYVLEHHSLVDAGKDSEEAARGQEADHEKESRRLARLLAENWDAPLVVTTSVQLLESLFADRPSACRKLHRLAGSVILCDEVQTLPSELAVPTLAALAHFAQRYGATVVFSTATQPAFDHLDSAVRELGGRGWQPREIVPAELELFERARRTRVVWDVEREVGWEELAGELAGREQVLAIVNLKRHARELALALRQHGVEGLFHLSTNQCPAHRQVVLAEVRQRLESGAPCRLVSTQCVEAGVDVDFPAVYRALGPLDAITQAAGRCNRNGRRPEPGEVHVFRPLDPKGLFPPGAYAQAAKVTELLMKEHGLAAMDLDVPKLYRDYYRLLYDLTKTTGGRQELRHALTHLDFPQVAKEYRLIREDTINVLVPYDPDVFAELRRQLTADGRLTRTWVRRARHHAVSLYRPHNKADVWNCLEPAPLGRGETSDDWFLYLVASHYDPELGLQQGENFWLA